MKGKKAFNFRYRPHPDDPVEEHVVHAKNITIARGMVPLEVIEDLVDINVWENGGWKCISKGKR